MSTLEKIIAILARQAVLEPGEISAESTPDSLGLDSMGMVETIFAIEEVFDISVPFNANAPGESGFDISSVGAIARAVDGLLHVQPA